MLYTTIPPAWPQRVRTNPSLTCCHSLREHLLTPRGSLLRHSHPDRRLSVRVLKCASLLPSKHVGAVRLPLGARGLSACVSALLVGAPGRRLAVCCGGPLAVCLCASSAYGVALRVSLCVPLTLLVGACPKLGLRKILNPDTSSPPSLHTCYKFCRRRGFLEAGSIGPLYATLDLSLRFSLVHHLLGACLKLGLRQNLNPDTFSHLSLNTCYKQWRRRGFV